MRNSFKYKFLSKNKIYSFKYNYNTVANHLSGIKEAATFNINIISKNLIAEGKDIVKFGLGQSPFPIPNELQESFKENCGKNDYIESSGLSELRSSICSFYKKRHNKKFDGDQVLIGSGTKPLFFLLQMIYDGQLVLPSPSWSDYSPQASILNKKSTQWIDTTFESKWKLTPKTTEEFLQKNFTNCKTPPLLVLNAPSNPTGISYEEKELKEISEVLKKYNAVVVSDEIYGELYYKSDDKKTLCPSISTYYPEGTIISSGISKFVGAGGWRVGYFIFPKRLQYLQKIMRNVMSESHSTVSAPAQFASISAYDNFEQIQDNYLVPSIKILKVVSKKMFEIFSSFEHKGKKIKVHLSDGAFYFFLSFEDFKTDLSKKEINSSNKLCDSLLRESGVAMLSGSNFGRPDEELTMRTSYVDFNGDVAIKLFQNSSEVSEQQILEACSRCINGANRIVDWLKINLEN